VLALYREAESLVLAVGCRLVVFANHSTMMSTTSSLDRHVITLQ